MNELKKFILNDLERNAVKFKNVFFDQEKFKEAVFRAFKKWGQNAKNGDDGELNVRIEADGFTHLTFTNENAFCFLPNEEDDSFQSYEKRMMKLTNGKRFQTVIGDLPSWDLELWTMTNDFLDHFFQETGILARKIEAGLFVGNFPYTPVGVHWDGDPVLTLMLNGSKTMRAWPKLLWEKIHGPRPETNYQHLIEKGFSVTGHSGEWIHCPSDFYHVFETNGLGINFSLSFGGLSTRQTPHINAIEQLGSNWNVKKKRKLKFKVDKSGLVKAPIHLLKDAKNGRDALLKSIDQNLIRDWLTRRSRHSLFGPIRKEPKKGNEINLNGNKIFFVVYNNQLELAFNGHSLSLKNSKKIRSQIDFLNKGESLPIKNLSKQFTQWLLSTGASTQSRKI